MTSRALFFCNKRLGSVSNYDDHGSENVAKTMNLRPFKLYRVYLDSLNLSNAGAFSWSCTLKDFIQFQNENGKFFSNLSSYVHALALGGFTS